MVPYDGAPAAACNTREQRSQLHPQVQDICQALPWHRRNDGFPILEHYQQFTGNLDQSTTDQTNSYSLSHVVLAGRDTLGDQKIKGFHLSSA